MNIQNCPKYAQGPMASGNQEKLPKSNYLSGEIMELENVEIVSSSIKQSIFCLKINSAYFVVIQINTCTVSGHHQRS